mmetsp:Transcript_23498/g.57109  ORF Transcript_23498/g.57109 Transcript_23498/m.57109 type:complete len:448 (-) Transcript_23498:471-1814(-)
MHSADIHGKVAGLAAEGRLHPGPVVGGGLDADHLRVAEAELEGPAGGEGQGVEPEDPAPGDARVGEGQEVAGLLRRRHRQPPPRVRRRLPVVEIVGLRRRQLRVRPPGLRRRRVPRAPQIQEAPVLSPAHVHPVAPVPQAAAQGLALVQVQAQGRAVRPVVALVVPVAEAVGAGGVQVDTRGLEVALGVALVVADEGVGVVGDGDVLPRAVPAVERAVGVVRGLHRGDGRGRGLLGRQIHNSIHGPEQVPRTRQIHGGHRLGHPAHPLAVDHHDPIPISPQVVPRDLQRGLLPGGNHVVHPDVRAPRDHHRAHGGGGDEICVGGVVAVVLLTDGPAGGGDEDPGVLGLGVFGGVGHGGRQACSVSQQEPPVPCAVHHVPRALHPAHRGVVGQRAGRPQPRMVQAQRGRAGLVRVVVAVAEAPAPRAPGGALGEALVAGYGGGELGHG